MLYRLPQWPPLSTGQPLQVGKWEPCIMLEGHPRCALSRQLTYQRTPSTTSLQIFRRVTQTMGVCWCTTDGIMPWPALAAPVAGKSLCFSINQVTSNSKKDCWLPATVAFSWLLVETPEAADPWPVSMSIANWWHKRELRCVSGNK